MEEWKDDRKKEGREGRMAEVKDERRFGRRIRWKDERMKG